MVLLWYSPHTPLNLSFLVPGTPGLGTTGVAIPKRSMCTRSTRNEMVGLPVIFKWTDLRLIKGLFISDSWLLVTSLWTHSYSYHVLVCTVNSHKKWCNYGTWKNVQSEKNDLALEGQLLFLKWVLSPCPAGLQTDINWLLPHLQTRGRRQATFVPQSNTQLPLAKWLHSSFWEFL